MFSLGHRRFVRYRRARGASPGASSAPCGAAAPLRAGVAMEFAGHIGAGRDGKPQPWFSQRDPPASRLHLAFNARGRAEVGAFHAAALAAGARDNGAPGLRPHCHPNYYGAFAIDPDGHNIEAVCHSPEP
ncbi:MAG TPA: VOC family protein [Roseiarcus sp.]|nr:VOC family protein [Roseiarcus sp.]